MTQIHNRKHTRIDIRLQYIGYIEQYILKLHIHQHVALLCDFIDKEPSSYEEAIERKEWKDAIVLGGHLTILGFTSCGDTILEEVAGFSPLWFPRGKLFVSLVSFDYYCACYSLI